MARGVFRIVALGVLAVAGIGRAVADEPSTDAAAPSAPAASSPAVEAAVESPGFWAARDAAYRTTARGPFTAVYSAYLGIRAEENLYVVEDQLVEKPKGRGSALRVNFAAPGFVVGPVKAKGFKSGRMGEVPITETWFVGKEAGDSLDLNVGRFLVSLDMQDEKTGRILVFDPDLLAAFPGFAVFPESDAYRIPARLEPADGTSIELGTSRGLSKAMVRAATIRFRVDGVEQTLTGFRSPDDAEGSPLFVPFRDVTSGEETYGVGRYLRVDPDESDPTQATVDFNRATNPWCAYSEHYNCIVPPPENDLEVAVRAGEKSPPGHSEHP
jgi:hypothetical protein